MGTPVSIKSLFSAHSDDDEEEPDWLSAPRPAGELFTAPSASSDDPFDLTIVSPAKPAPDKAETSGARADVADDRNVDSEAHKGGPSSPDTKPDTSHTATESKPTPANAPTSKATQPVTRVPLKIPASLKCQRLLVELPGEPESAVDLAGDSGAVGRISIASDKKSVQLDLKGVMYKGSLLAMPCTACIVNVGQSEAKIEAFCNEFLQLETDTTFASGEVVMEGSVEHWAIHDADFDFVNATGKDDVQGDEKGKSSKAKKPKQRGLGASSGKVVKVSKKKATGAGAKGKGTRKRK